MTTTPVSTAPCLDPGCNRPAARGHRGYCRTHNEQRQALQASAPKYTTCERCGCVVESRLLARHGATHRKGC